MKPKNKHKYAYFQAKAFLFGLGMLLLACVGTGVIYSVWQGRGGDWVVTVLHDVFRLSWNKAHSIYQSVFRNHASAMWIYCTAALFFLVFGFFLCWLTNCFRKIEKGIDDLLSENNQQISLPPELSALEGKLNTVRQTLERRTLEAKLAEQRKNDLVMYLAHDIRTPLTSVIGYLNLLNEAQDMPQELRAKYTGITLDKANRLEALAEEFFEITRYNLHQIPLQTEKVDLYYLLAQLAEEFYPILTGKGNTLTIQAREDLTVEADPMKLARVFNNILKNASTFADENSEILIMAAKDENGITVTIENHGSTIPAEKLQSIFERFYRVDDARSTGRGGAGLGLAIAKEIVNLHGGTITARSENHITAFIVTLPAAVQEERSEK